MLHAWLAVPGLGDGEFTVLRYPLKGDDRVVDEGEGESGKWQEKPGEGMRDAEEVKETEEWKCNGIEK